MMNANKPKLGVSREVCQMKPLQECLDKNNGDISKCTHEVDIFEQTCSKGKGYVHDRDGLDDFRSEFYGTNPDKPR